MPAPQSPVCSWDRRDLEQVAVPLIAGRGAWNGGAAPPDDSPLSHAETDVVWKQWRAAVNDGKPHHERDTLFTAHQRALVDRLEFALADAIREGTRTWVWVITNPLAASFARIRPILESGAFAYTANVDNHAVIAAPQLVARWRDVFARQVFWNVIDEVRDRDDHTVGDVIADMWDPRADGAAADLPGLLSVARRLT